VYVCVFVCERVCACPVDGVGCVPMTTARSLSAWLTHLNKYVYVCVFVCERVCALSVCPVDGVGCVPMTTARSLSAAWLHLNIPRVPLHTPLPFSPPTEPIMGRSGRFHARQKTAAMGLRVPPGESGVANWGTRDRFVHCVLQTLRVFPRTLRANRARPGRTKGALLQHC
jgi:predicted small integral membrane protein